MKLSFKQVFFDFANLAGLMVLFVSFSTDATATMVISKHKKEASSFNGEFSADGKKVLLTSSGQFEVTDAVTGKILMSNSNGSAVGFLAKDGSQVLLQNGDVIESSSGKTLRHINCDFHIESISADRSKIVCMPYQELRIIASSSGKDLFSYKGSDSVEVRMSNTGSRFAISPVVTSTGNSLKVFTLDGGKLKELYSRNSELYEMNDFDLSSDGKILALGLYDKQTGTKMQVIDLDTGKTLHEGIPIGSDVLFIPNSLKILMNPNVEYVRNLPSIFDVSDGKITTLDFLSDSPYTDDVHRSAVRFSSDGSQLVFRDDILANLKLLRKINIPSFEKGSGKMFTAFSPNGQNLVFGLRSGLVLTDNLREVPTVLAKAPVCHIGNNGSEIAGSVSTPNGTQQLVIAHAFKTQDTQHGTVYLDKLSVIDSQNCRPHFKYSEELKNLRSSTVSSDGKWWALVSGMIDEPQIVLVNLLSYDYYFLKPSLEEIRNISFSSDNGKLLAFDYSGRETLFDLLTRNELPRQNPPDQAPPPISDPIEGTNKEIIYFPDGIHALTLSSESINRLVDLQTGTVTYLEGSLITTSAKMSTDGKHILAHDGRLLKLIDSNTGFTIKSIPNCASYEAFSFGPDDSIIVIKRTGDLFNYSI